MLLMALTPLTLQTVHADEPQGADIEFATKLIDLGTLSMEDDVQVVRLAFTNTGDLPLVVTEVRTSCSCTTVEYDRRSRVMPGERGTITVRMNPESAPTGSFSRVIAVHSTALSGTQHITLKAEIDEARSETSNQTEGLAEVTQTVPPPPCSAPWWARVARPCPWATALHPTEPRRATVARARATTFGVSTLSMPDFMAEDSERVCHAPALTIIPKVRWLSTSQSTARVT